MKKYILSLLSACLALVTQATHITGGEMYYSFNGVVGGEYQYFVTLKLYQRCNSGRQFPNPTIISIFDKTTGARFTVPYTELDWSLKIVGLPTHIPVTPKSATKPGYTRMGALVESVQGWPPFILSFTVYKPVSAKVCAIPVVLDVARIFPSLSSIFHSYDTIKGLLERLDIETDWELPQSKYSGNKVADATSQSATFICTSFR